MTNENELISPDRCADALLLGEEVRKEQKNNKRGKLELCGRRCKGLTAFGHQVYKVYNSKLSPRLHPDPSGVLSYFISPPVKLANFGH